MVAEAGGRRNRDSALNGDKVSVWEDEDALEIHGYITMWMCLMPLNRTLKNGENGQFHYVYFTSIKKFKYEN